MTTSERLALNLQAIKALCDATLALLASDAPDPAATTTPAPITTAATCAHPLNQRTSLNGFGGGPDRWRCHCGYHHG